MADTTTEKVINYYGDKLEDEGISEDFVSQCVEDSKLKVMADGVPEKFTEYAQRIYACHLISKNITNKNSDYTNVSMEKVGPMQRQYKGYDGFSKYDDSYEAEYNKLLRSLGLGLNKAQFM